MNCWHCNSELIWGGDHSYEDVAMEGDGIVSNLSCPKCPTTVEVFHSFGVEGEEILLSSFVAAGTA